MTMMGENEVLKEKLVPVLLCSKQIPYRQDRD